MMQVSRFLRFTLPYANRRNPREDSRWLIGARTLIENPFFAHSDSDSFNVTLFKNILVLSLKYLSLRNKSLLFFLLSFQFS